MGQTSETLHVCCYYDEHTPKATLLYGSERVQRQLKKRINCCNKCEMLPDLLKYVEVGKYFNLNTKVSNDSKFIIDAMKPEEVVEDKYRQEDMVSSGNKVKIIYHEVYLTVDEFFKPPEEGKRWIDML